MRKVLFIFVKMSHLVVSNLVINGEKQDEESVGGQKRVEALRQLLKMNPSEALTVRSLCVSTIIYTLSKI